MLALICQAFWHRKKRQPWARGSLICLKISCNRLAAMELQHRERVSLCALGLDSWMKQLGSDIPATLRMTRQPVLRVPRREACYSGDLPPLPSQKLLWKLSSKWIPQGKLEQRRAGWMPPEKKGGRKRGKERWTKKWVNLILWAMTTLWK